MNQEYLNKITKEINEKLRNETTKYKENYNKRNILHMNLFETNMPLTVLFSATINFALAAAIVSLSEGISLPGVLSLVPAEFISPVLGLAAFAIGSVSTNLMGLKRSNARKLKKFSNAVTNIDKKEEIAILEMEMEKFSNRRVVLHDTYSKLEQNFMNVEYKNELEKADLNKKEQDIEKNIIHLDKQLDANYDELDDLSAQTIINHKLGETYSKGTIYSDALVGCALTGMYFSFPYVVMSNLISFSSSLTAFATIATPFIAGAVVTALCKVKKQKSERELYTRMYNKVTNETVPQNEEEIYERQLSIGQKLEYTENLLIDAKTKNYENDWLLSEIEKKKQNPNNLGKNSIEEKADKIIKIMECAPTETIEKPKVFKKTTNN